MTSTACAARPTARFPLPSTAAAVAAARAADGGAAGREAVFPAAPEVPAGGLNEILLELIAGRGLSNLLAELNVLRERLDEDLRPGRWYGPGDAGERQARLAALCQLAAARVARLGRLRGMDAPPIVQRNEERILVAALRALLEAAGSRDAPPPSSLPAAGPSNAIGKEMP